MLIAYQVAIELVKEPRPLVEQIRKHDNTLAKQGAWRLAKGWDRR
jgi:hypothetical protein